MKSIMKGKLDKWFGKKGQKFQKSRSDIFANIIEQFEKKKTSTFYIGHITIFKYMIKCLFNDDFIIENGLKAIKGDRDIFDMLICPFSCNFIFELYEENNNEYVQILINGKVLNEKNALRNKNIKIIDGKITFDDFKNLFRLGKKKKKSDL